MTAFSDEMAARCLEARALIGEAEGLTQNRGSTLLRLSSLSDLPYETVRIIRKGGARRPSEGTLQKLRDAVAKLRKSPGG